MKELAMLGLGVGLLLASASAGFAVSSDPRVGHPARQLAAERAADREADQRPYALTGSEKLTWEKQVGPNVSGRARTMTFKRSPAES